jgi:Zn-dependent alcohol dehydrogenase
MVTKVAGIKAKRSYSRMFWYGWSRCYFKCIGINATMRQAIEYARKGSEIIVIGVCADLDGLPFSVQIIALRLYIRQLKNLLRILA